MIVVYMSKRKHNESVEHQKYIYIYIATYYDQEELINKRSELTSKCRHDNMTFFLANYKASNHHFVQFQDFSTPSIIGIFRIVPHS